MHEGDTASSPLLNKTGQGTALPTGFPSSALSDGGNSPWPPAWHWAGDGWGDGMCQRWLPPSGLTEAPCLGAEKGIGMSCAFMDREQPPVILLYQCIY